MGQADVARVDATQLHDIAGRYDAAADIVVDAFRNDLGRLTFDGALAGSAHVAAGDALRRAVDEVAQQSWQWSRAAAEIAAALRSSAARYRDAEARAAERLG